MIADLLAFATDKTNFVTVANYIEFCARFLAFSESGLQATIISKNEPHYQFFQFKADGNHAISRPINSQLMYTAKNEQIIAVEFSRLLADARSIPADDTVNRAKIRNSVYTIQQSIGITLDALPQGKSNTARKVTGDLFERLVRLLISGMGIDCKSGTIGIPVVVPNVAEFTMGYQHDLIIRRDGHMKILGSVKTSSKDRIDKIFIDKFLYSKLTGTQLPHIAIFLNDVQRKGKPPKYGVSATFLPGHFKGYSIKLNPLDGVYYCDLRPNMTTDEYLKSKIHPIDRLFCNDLWELVAAPHPDVEAAEPLLKETIDPEKEFER